MYFQHKNTKIASPLNKPFHIMSMLGQWSYSKKLFELDSI